jgi:hypothetical protein
MRHRLSTSNRSHTLFPARAIEYGKTFRPTIADDNSGGRLRAKLSVICRSESVEAIGRIDGGRHGAEMKGMGTGDEHGGHRA